MKNENENKLNKDKFKKFKLNQPVEQMSLFSFA
jgi:hypothetical protein